MTYRFRLAGEYFDEKQEGAMLSGGEFTTLEMARRAMSRIRAFMRAPVPRILPPELEELAAIVDPETLEIALYAQKSDKEMWVMSFDDKGEPTEATDDAELLWSLMKSVLVK